MSPLPEGQTYPVSTWPAELRWVFRLVSTNNPFYVVSAGLFLVGLWLSFGTPEDVKDNWLLMGGLTAYTLLLAGTAILLIRFARVWDDARTVLLLVVLMFLAASCTLDYLTVFDSRFGGGRLPWNAILSTLLALGVTVGVSETVLRAVRLKLGWLYRGPYYLLLAVFLLYPLTLMPFLDKPREPEIMWGLFAFSSVAGIAFLTLIPAIRRGAEYVRKNGSPWAWPLFPWTLFGLLALAVPGRAILMCYSMHLIDVTNLYDMTFGPYFLVPFGMALTVLLLEAGLVTKRTGLIIAALSMPVALLALAMVGHRTEPIYLRFLDIFTTTLGAGPVYCTMLACSGFYLYAALRKAPGAIESLIGTVALLTFVNPGGFQREIGDPQPAALVVASTVLIGLGIWQRGSWRCFFGACGLALAVGLAFPIGNEFHVFRWLIAFHGVLLAMLIIGFVFDDDLGRSLRVLGPGLLVLVSFTALMAPTPRGMPPWGQHFYPLAIAILLAGYGVVLRHGPTLVMSAVLLVVWSIASGWNVYRHIRTMVAGMDYLVLSLLVFALAILFSLAKSRVLARWWRTQSDE